MHASAPARSGLRPSRPQPEAALDRDRPSGREIAVLIAFCAVGCALRVWQIASAGIDHFDEGVYAFSALGLTDPTQPHRLYPGQTRFSPPVFPGLLAATTGVFHLAPDVAALVLNAALGILTIVAVWWSGRRWFGASAGLVAAGLVALSESHIVLSRSALTDVAFGLFFLLALVATVAALERPDFRRTLLAGLAVGLAWNTKYHGWFVVVVAAGALVGRGLWERRRPLVDRTAAMHLLAIGGIALACYLPWMAYMHAEGLGKVANNYLGMLSPYWFRNAWQQIRMEVFLDGPLTRASVLVALLGAMLVARRARPARFGLALPALALCSLALGGWVTVALLAGLAAAALLRERPPLHVWALLGVVGLWLVAAPIYRPYFRLLVPLNLVLYLLAGAWLARLLARGPASTRWRPVVATAAAAAAVFGTASLLPHTADPWRPSRDAATAANAIAAVIPPGKPVLVIGEPAVAYYLNARGRPTFGLANTGVQAYRRASYLVTGVYGRRAPTLRAQLAALSDSLTRVGSVPFVPRDLRLLDDFTPAGAARYRAHPDSTYTLTVYRVLGGP